MNTASPQGVDQVENLRTELLPQPKADDPKTVRMPFKTAYILTREQEDELVRHALERMRQIEGQMGREADDMGAGIGNAVGTTWDASTAKSGSYNPDSFLGKRDRYTQRYYSHVEDRAKADTVYEHSNETASLDQRITRQGVARTITFFFGQPDDTDWFSTEAVGAEDEIVSDKIKKHSRWKVDQCGVKDRLTETVEFARVRGEAVVKVTHQQRGQIYKRTATILVQPAAEPEAPTSKDQAPENIQAPNAETGDLAAPDITEPSNGPASYLGPILDAHGDYIVRGDTFIDEMEPMPMAAPVALPGVGNYGAPPVDPVDVQRPGEPADPAQMGATAANASVPVQAMPPPMVPTGRKLLKRDGVTELPAVPHWQEQVITRRLINFEGPEAELVYFKDFFCPLDAKNVQTADAIGHSYDMSVMKVAELFRGQYGEGDAAIADMKRAVEALQNLTNSSPAPESAQNQPRQDMGETNTDTARSNPNCQVAEIYLTYDADGDGIMEEIFLLLDRRNGVPIYYEYLANVTVRGERPFYVLRPRAVDARWYGMGDMEFFNPEQSFIDLQINRHNFRDSKTGRVTFWRPYNTLEGDLDPTLKLHDGHTYTPKDGKKDEDVLSYVELPGDSESLEYLIDKFMQFMQTKSGVTNSADQETAGLPSNKLATGINEIHDSGQELFSHTIATLFPSVKAALRAVVDVIYANMNRVEVFNFFNGEANEILSLTPEDTRDLAMNVTLALSKTQQRKALQTGDQAQAIVDWFYSKPPMLQERIATFARQRLKALGVSQSDTIIEPIDPAMVPPGIDPASGQPMPPAQPENVTQMPATSAI